MSKRKLKRQLSLAQVVMLGTAGTIAAEIFVLTGHAAGLAGPASVIALLLAGLLSYSVALNYCELATTFPFTGGALTYVREAWGTGLLSSLVGSFDCLSSTFYSALSAVGFAYSLRVFIPSLPIIPTALVVIGIFVLLNILGVTKVGNTQIMLGGVLLLAMAIYVLAGLILPQGFRWQTFAPNGTLFVQKGIWRNLATILTTVALVYNAYVGFEVIADDAEEIRSPERNIPRGILISLTVVTVVYVLVALVTLGTIPWQELAGSETALTDAVRHFLPGWGVPMMAFAGMIATLTSVNTSMLSATREAFTMSRDGTWPRFMSRLGRFRTPYMAILVIGAIVCFVAVIGMVDFLAYISSSGYLFVLFWSNLAMIRLRKRYPDLKRPFRVPLYPLTPYLAVATCVGIIAFTQRRALLFGAGVLTASGIFYYAYRASLAKTAARKATRPPKTDRVLVPVANPRTAESLVHLAGMIAQASEDTSICVLTIVPVSPRLPEGIVARLADRLGTRQRALLSRLAAETQQKNVPFYTKIRPASSVSEGILGEVQSHGAVKLVVMGWPGPLDAKALAENPVKVVLQRAPTNVAVLLDRGLGVLQDILVPVGGGPHSRLAVRLAYEIAEQAGAEITAFRCLCGVTEVEEMEDQLLLLREIVEDELGSVSSRMVTRVACVDFVPEGILAETRRKHYDLIVIGASEEWAMKTRLFGSVDDWIVERVQCSVLLIRAHEPAPISWIRRQAKRIEKLNGQLYQPMPQ